MCLVGILVLVPSENGGRAVTGTRVEDDVEALGARNCEVERGVGTRLGRDGDVNATRGLRM